MKANEVNGVGIGRITHREILPGADIELNLVVEYTLYESPQMQEECRSRAFGILQRLIKAGGNLADTEG